MSHGGYETDRPRPAGGALALAVGFLTLVGFAASWATPVGIFNQRLSRVLAQPAIHGVSWYEGKLHSARAGIIISAFWDPDSIRVDFTSLVLDGDTWKEGRSFKGTTNYGRRGDEDWVFYPDRGEIYREDRLQRTIGVGAGYREEVFFPEHFEEVWIFQEGEGNRITLQRRDLDLKELEKVDLGRPEDYTGSVLERKFRVFDPEQPTMVWETKRSVSYARVGPDGLGEVRIIPGRLSIEAIGNQCGSPFILLKRAPLMDDEGPEADDGDTREQIYEPYLQHGETFEAMPTLSLPDDGVYNVDVYCPEGVPNLVYWGDAEGRKEWRDGQWLDREVQLPPGAGAGYVKPIKDYQRLLKSMLYIVPLSLFLLPFGFLLAAGLMMDLGGDDPTPAGGAGPRPVNPVPRAGSTTARIAAFLVDLLVVAGLAALIGLVWTHDGEAAWSFTHAWKVLSLVAGFLVAMPVYLILLEGGVGVTLGKKLLGLRVVMLNGDEPSYGEALNRNLLRPLDLLLGGLPAAVSMALSPQRQRLGDRLAETTVVRAKNK